MAPPHRPFRRLVVPLAVCLGVACLLAAARRGERLSCGAAMHPPMPLLKAFEVLGIRADSSAADIKKAYRERIRTCHPDVIGDGGEKLQEVRDAYEVVDIIIRPNVWDYEAMNDNAGLPSWAAGLLNGVRWSDDCGSYADFLSKPDFKAMAVGELNEVTGMRPWAAVWGKFSQQDANSEALRVCRQHGKCKLVYVGSGNARARSPTVSPQEHEEKWWRDNFAKGGQNSGGGFGWMPMIDPKKERICGYKTIHAGSREGLESKVRVPVLKPVIGSGIPYYYSPTRPKERVHMKKENFKHVNKMSAKDPRIAEILNAPIDAEKNFRMTGIPEMEARARRMETNP
mmetsp:Transcript_36778/g.98043  ORF Transcript_36778/g.98043 Transcript_36778/m.98043 type:complete len:342 (-) Transcript_36778:69-1094(-)